MMYKKLCFEKRPYTRIDNMVFDYLSKSPNFKKINKYLIPIYLRIARYVNNATMSCYISQTKIAKETGWSRKTVIKAIKILEKNFLLKIKRRRRPRKSNLYTLIVPGFLAKEDNNSASEL